jgi:hypothetical protein
MRTRSKLQRFLTVGLLAVIVTGTLAPLAQAHGRYRRYRGPVIERRVVVRPVYRSVRVVRRVPYARYTVWRSGRGPVVAGFLGGLFLGATLANAAPHGYVYWDSYCHRGFASLELYDAHCRRHSHEHEIQVVEGDDDPPPCDDGDRGGWDDEDQDD